MKKNKERGRPTLTDPGYVYSGYVPYVAMSSWHHDNVQAAQDAESSSSGGGVNTGFSSGFSGAGGSSSF